jgi:NADPH:quinone reductase
MRAVVFDQYGGPEGLHVTDIAEPVIGPGQILIEVTAAAVNPADYKWRAGMFAAMVPIQLPHVLGYDVAGTVLEAGEGVHGFKAGDRVAAMLNPITKGGYADRAVVEAAAAARVPDGIEDAVAASVPCAALTGVQAIDETIRPKAGETILITGATGAVGHAAMLTAIRSGCRVIAAVRRRYFDEARALGAADVIALGDDGWSGAPFDHVFDTVGGADVKELCRHLKPGGRLITAATNPIDPTGLPVAPEFFAVHPDGNRLRAILEDVAAGTLAVRVAQRLPLEQAAEAHRRVEAGGITGKVVLVP